MVECKRPSCATKYFPPGTQLFYVVGNRAGEGRAVCEGCWRYYEEKAKGIRSGDGVALTQAKPTTHIGGHHGYAPLPFIADHAQPRENVQQLVAQGQRGELPAAHVQAISASLGAGGIGPPPQQVTYIQARTGPLVGIPGRVAGPPGVAGELAGGSAIGWGRSQLPLPPGQTGALCAVPAPVGYNLNHLFYQDKRNQAAKTAYASGLSEVIVVAFYLSLKSSKIGGKPSVIAGITETIGNVNVHIGAQELKQLAWAQLQPGWTQYAQGYPLALDDLVLRNKSWARIEPGFPDDRDVLAGEFFKEKKAGTGPKFDPGKGTEVHLHVPQDIWNGFEAYLHAREAAELEEQLRQRQVAQWSNLVMKVYLRALHILSLPVVQTKMPQLTQSKRAHLLPTSTPKTNSRAVTDQAISSQRSSASVVNHDLLHLALLKQQVPTRASVSSLFRTKASIVTVRCVLRFSDIDALTRMSASISGMDYLGEAVSGRLVLDTSQETAEQGTFKRALFGTLAADDTLWPCAGDDADPLASLRAKLLMQDVQCIVWANALLELVYAYVNDMLRDEESLPVLRGGRKPSAVPQLRFVHAAFAITEKEDKAYLIEERIPFNQPHVWFKYINNDSGKPIPQKEKLETERALFLAFSQHVQLWKTQGLAFVTDYQGGLGLLSDPQIVTNPLLASTTLFAAGNLPDTHRNFIESHKCNKFCKRFKLPSLKELAVMLRNWDADLTGPPPSSQLSDPPESLAI
ncbi:hypothetical protein FKP32DRAFT_1683478 [Trametes sanguinea]|nr:hypothetical protein FKP32DRAFT_1683478 [Trametes sanguinea]